MKLHLIASVVCSFVCGCFDLLGSEGLFINEVHYDNTGADVGEGVEVAGPAGTLLEGYEVVLYNGLGGVVYGRKALSGVMPDLQNGCGVVWVAAEGMQNGAPDGVALVRKADGVIVHGISYEGSMTLSTGVVLADILVKEDPAPAAERSLQLIGSGGKLGDFTWTGPVAASPGLVNVGQVLSRPVVPEIVLTLGTEYVKEGEGGVLRVSLRPVPVGPVQVGLRSGVSAVRVPELVTVPESGMAEVPVTTGRDGVMTGYRPFTLTATAVGGVWPERVLASGIVDVDRPAVSPGSLRVMSMNVLQGVGVPGSVGFDRVREVVERISPDVLLLQEAESDDEFLPWRVLLRQMGFPDGAEYRAVTGDGFPALPLVRGEIGATADINLLTASRYPITRRLQCGRGVVPGRLEITRYPLLTVVDVPGVPEADDPVIVNVHFKADFSEASQFRRAVEGQRLREVLTAEGYAAAGRQLMVVGDFNDVDWFTQVASFDTSVAAIQMPGVAFGDGSELPVTYALGADLKAPVVLPYATFPGSGLAPLGMRQLRARQANGVDERTFNAAPYKLDYFFVSERIAARQGPPVEIYSSLRETQYDGQAKAPRLPQPRLSFEASDHFALFADIPLVDLPVLGVAFNRRTVDEGEAGLAVEVTVSPAPSQPLTVSLASWREPRLEHAETVMIPAGMDRVTVPVCASLRRGVQAHRTVTLVATAAGHQSGQGAVSVRERCVSGLAVISRYTEPAEAGGGRAVEVRNTSGGLIDFAITPLELRRYSGGSMDGLMEAEVTSGTLADGAVLVLGDAPVGRYLVSVNLLPQPTRPFESQAEHTLFSNGTVAVFQLEELGYDGDDAMELVVGGMRCDVLGQVGVVSAGGWGSAGGAATVDQTLVLAEGLLTGSAGWATPVGRYTGGAPSLARYGMPSSSVDAYLAWARAEGLVGTAAAPCEDPDGDGAANLVEYAFMTLPQRGASQPLVRWDGGKLSREIRSGDAFLSSALEVSGDLRTWSPAAGVDEIEPVGSGVRLRREIPFSMDKRYFRESVRR